MGGQACVFYGAAQVSKDIDLALPAEPANIERLRLALKELAAERIAVPVEISEQFKSPRHRRLRVVRILSRVP